MLACVGASLSLLAAACQTTPGGPVADGHELIGEVPAYPPFSRAKIASEDGERVDLRIGPDRRFEVHDLRPGTYKLSFTDSCGNTQEVEDVVIADSDVDLGRLQLETLCIVVGQMMRVDDQADA